MANLNWNSLRNRLPQRTARLAFLLGVFAVACGCGDDPLGPMPEMARDVVDDVGDAKETGKKLVENPERLKSAADSWKNGPPRLGK